MTNLPKIFKRSGLFDEFLDHNSLEPWDLLFKDLFVKESDFLPALNTQTKYPVDIIEDDKGLNFEIAVAGIDKKDIEIEEVDGYLKVSYKKEEEKDDSDSNKQYIQKSIAKRSFNFCWRISDKFDLQNINASMDKGILKIEIPRSEEKEVVKNTIKIK